MATSVALRKLLLAFGKALRECRKAARLSQEDVAGALGPNRKFISNLERGKQEPGLQTLFKLARAIGVRVSEILRRTEDLLLPASQLDRMDRNTEARVPVGSDTCPNCRTVYKVYAQPLKKRERGTFKCSECKEKLATWFATTAFVYEIKRLRKARGR